LASLINFFSNGEIEFIVKGSGRNDIEVLSAAKWEMISEYSG